MKKIFSLISLSVLFILISSSDCESGRYVAERKQNEISKNVVNTVGIPDVKYFQEAVTIYKWNETWNVSGAVSYVYLISYGKILGYYVVDGKPASTRSYLLPEESYYSSGAVLSNPDVDGTYGENNPGIRFFTAEGIAVEWAGAGASYLYSNTPISFGVGIPKLNPKKE